MQSSCLTILSDVLLLACFRWITVGCHVRLIYPPAQKWALDGLNSVMAVGECGMPKGHHDVHKLQAGSKLDVFWSVGSPHWGGYRIELLDKEYKLIATLDPPNGKSDEWAGGNNSVVNLAMVTLPKDITCAHCLLRLLRLGAPYVPTAEHPHPLFYFRSCSDIAILDADTKTNCSNHGKWDKTACICDERFSGEVCQYEDECARDSDCQNGGKCIDTHAQAYPKRQCYCPFGSHGQLCAMQSSVTTFDFHPDLYRSRNSSYSNVTLYWRILPDIGEIEVVIIGQNKNWIAVGWRPDGINGSCRTVPPIPTEPITKVSNDGELVTTLFDYFPPSFISMPLHPMACNDIVTAAAVGNYSHVRDMYTRDVSTPREDQYFDDGTDDLTAALAFEDPSSGMMTLLFRKKLIAKDMYDQSVDGMMHVIWAMGEEPSVLSPEDLQNDQCPKEANIKTFYRKGELNSHPHTPKNRGYFKINLKTGGSF